MKVAQKLYNKGAFVKSAGDEPTGNGNLLVLGFGSKSVLIHDNIYDTLKTEYPDGDIVICSTSGEI